jgi:putative transposase
MLSADPAPFALLRDAFRTVMAHHPFRIEAMVVLPDHLHSLWTLPDGDADYPLRWNAIKGRFSAALPPAARPVPCPARRRRGEQAVWQRRYWEHRIRDHADFERHYPLEPGQARPGSGAGTMAYSSFRVRYNGSDDREH